MSIVYVVLRHEPAATIASARASLLRAGKELNVRFRPLHPGADDDDLSRFYIAETGSAQDADQIVQKLGHAESIEAAYVKPPDAAP
jgi:hypothetical protein